MPGPRVALKVCSPMLRVALFLLVAGFLLPVQSFADDKKKDDKAEKDKDRPRRDRDKKDKPKPTSCTRVGTPSTR